MIETQRLILRPPQEIDFEAFAAAQGNREFKRHTGGVLSRARAFEEFRAWLNFWEIKDYCFFSIIEKQTNSWIGRAGPTHRANENFQELGWSIIPQFQGMGFAFEASQAAIEWTKRELNWNNLIFRISRENIQSQKLAQRLGAKNLGLEDPPIGGVFDAEVWAL